MIPADLLLQLITYLQKDTSVVRGRRALLDYIRKSAGARSGLLFILDKEQQALQLLERRGRSPHHSARRAGQPDPRRIPLHGLFAQALHTQRPLHIPDLYSDPGSLEEEKYWAWPGGHVVVNAIREAGNHNDLTGVLVLCFDTSQGEWTARAEAALSESSFLISSSLLAVYLNESEKDAISTLHELHATEQKAIIEQERSRIAREIHDGIVQQIAHAMQRLDFIQRTIEKEPEAALRDIAQVHAMLEESLNELRRSIMSLIPAQLEEQGFEAALQSLLNNYALNEPTLAIRYTADSPIILPAALEVPIFRFIQEALNNVIQHAHASQVHIRIRTLAGLLVVQISDNGQGFAVDQAVRNSAAGQHLGLRLMRERIEQAGGILDIQSKPGSGTTLKARFPLKTPSVMLTKREREVLRLLVEGSTNRAIAKKLSVSIETVKSHVHHIMQKMHARDRTHAAVIATRQHWL